MSYFLRRVDINDTNLRNGDYCSVTLRGRTNEIDEFEVIEGLMAIYDGHVYLLSNESVLNGTSVPIRMKDEASMRHSWIMCYVYNDTSFLWALQNCNDAEFEDIKQVANRVNLNTTNLQPWDYCPIVITSRADGTTEHDAVLVMNEGRHIYMFSNDESRNGASCDTRPMEFRGYEYSWLVKEFVNDAESFAIVMRRVSIQYRQTLDDVQVELRPPISQPQTPSELISKNYQQEVTFDGMHSYHAHHGCDVNLPIKRYTHRIGVELEVEFPTSSKRETFTDIKTNWFYCERDGSLGSNGCEIITIPLHPNDAKSHEFWKPLCDALTSLNAKSWDTSTCGCHVHIGREILGKDDDEKSQTLGKLLYFYHEFLKDALGNCKIYGRTHGYHDTICKTDISTAVKTLGSSVLKDKEVREKLDKSMKDRSQATRYFDINVMNSATIEFRKGRGSINPERIAMIVEWSELIVSYAKFTHWKNLSMETFKTFIKMKSGLSPMTMKFIEDYFA
jgi:hypothetical protein